MLRELGDSTPVSQVLAESFDWWFSCSCAFTDCSAMLYIGAARDAANQLLVLRTSVPHYHKADPALRGGNQTELPLMEVAAHSLESGSIAGRHQLAKARAGLGGTSQSQKSPKVLRRSPKVLGPTASAAISEYPMISLVAWNNCCLLMSKMRTVSAEPHATTNRITVPATMPLIWKPHGMQRTGSRTVFIQLTNDLTTRGFSAELDAFRAECAKTLNEFTPQPPRITTDFDLTLIKPLLQEFVPTVRSYAGYCDLGWADSLRGWHLHQTHLAWKKAQEESSRVGKGPAPPYCGSPFPGCNVSPAGDEDMPVLFANQCVLTLCNYHKFRDVRDWFASSSHMKGLHLRQKATWRRVMLLLESVLLNSPELAGISRLPLLFRLLKLFSKLLLLPSTMQVPSVHLAGHLQMRLPTAKELAHRRTTLPDPGPPVAVMDFACEGITFAVEVYAGHLVSTAQSAGPTPVSEPDASVGAEGVNATGPHAALIMAAVVEAMEAPDEAEAVVEAAEAPDEVEAQGACVEAAAAEVEARLLPAVEAAQGREPWLQWERQKGLFFAGPFAAIVQITAPLLVVRNRIHCPCVRKRGKSLSPLYTIFMERLPRVIWIAPMMLSSLFPAIAYGG
ncbi:hypothetical protein B484DRAFT_465364 [Ochromonadaceae sp. CCMP2298]|nr:hypothetical protein B484DRAFT_465364 [Ochromonadaceae sp. CCMP2298]